MKRLAGPALALCLLLSACVTPPPARVDDQSALSADQVARAVLAACGLAAEDMQTLADQIGEGDPEDYLPLLYHLPAGSWDDFAVYLASPTQATEVAVFRLAPQADPDAVEEGLETYRLDRRDTFTGYDPEQAAIAEAGCAILSAGEDYAALLLCPDPDVARAAFYQALDQAAPSAGVSPAPSPTDDPAAGRTPCHGRSAALLTAYPASPAVYAERA